MREVVSGAPDTPATGPGPASAPRRKRIVTILAVTLTAVAVLTAAAFLFRKPLRYGRVEPPEPALEGLPAPVARRIAEATADVWEHPYSPSSWGELGGVFEVHDLLAEALTCYERAERLDPTDFRWPYFAGRARALDDQPAALDDLLRAAAIRDDYAPLHARLGRVLVSADDLALARRHFERALQIDPGLIRARLDLARIALSQENAVEALRHLEAARDLGATSGEVHGLFAGAYRRLGDIPSALREQAKAEDHPLLEPMADPLYGEFAWDLGVSLRAYGMRAEAYRRDGRTAPALAEWARAAADYPESAVPPSHVARIHTEAGRPAVAVAAYERALRIDPDAHALRLERGRLLVQLGKVDDGLEEMRRACAGLPDDLAAQRLLARTLAQLGRTAEALEAFDRVFEIDPDDAPARFDHAVLLSNAGRGFEAAEAFRRVIAIDPTLVQAYLSLDRVLTALGRSAEAVAALREGLVRVPDDRNLLAALAWRLATAPDAAARDGAEARSIAEHLVAAGGGGDPAVLDVLAAACAEAGDVEAAVRHAEHVTRILDAAPATTPAARERARAASQRVELYRAGLPLRDPAP